MSSLLDNNTDSLIFNNTAPVDSIGEVLVNSNTQMSNNMTSLIQAIQNSHQSTVEKLIELNTKHLTATDKLIQNETKLTDNQTKLTDTVLTNQTVLTKVNRILESVVGDTSNNTLLNIINNIDSTQKSLIEKIGQYLVIPLYEQRMNDISTFYLSKLEDNVLCKLERYLLLYREGNFADLVLEFTQEESDDLSTRVYNIKKEAFSKYLTVTPGATCFDDLTEEAKKSYKFIRQYTSSFFKTIDGLMRSVRLYQKFLNTEGQLQALELDSEILNDPEKLKIYLEELNESQKKNVSLFETTVQLNLPEIGLKPEYTEYIKRYGLPNGWLFEAEKMALVIRDLVDTGIITDPGSVKVATTSGMSGHSSEGTTTEDDPLDKTATDTDTATATDTATDGETATATATATATDTATDSHSSCEEGEASDYSLSDNEMSDYEKDSNDKTVTYFVYLAQDSSSNNQHKEDTYYYPLYLTSLEASKNIDMSGVVDPTIDVPGNEYTDNDPVVPNGISSISFEHLPNVVFWQPNSHPYRAVGTDYFPPSALEYIHYTDLTNPFN